MHDILLLVAAAAVVVLPGTALLLALTVRRWLWVLGVAPAATIGVATLTAEACTVLHVPYGLPALAVATVILFALGLLWWLLGWRRSAETPRTVTPGWARVVSVLGMLMALGGIGYGVRMWISALHGLGTLPQEHDMIVHTELTAYIQRTGHGAPWQLLPVDLLSGKPVQFYPSGMHLLAAATGAITGNPIEGLNAVTVILLGIGLPLSAATLAYQALRLAGIATPFATLGGGMGAIVATGLYRPAIGLVHEGGILPNAAEFALVPGVIAALLSLRRRDWLAAIAAGVGCAGVITLHPSAAVIITVTLIAWWIGELLVRRGPHWVAGNLLPVALAGVVTVAVGLPVLLPSLSVAAHTSNFHPDFAPLSFGSALKTTLELPYGAFADITGKLQWVPAALALLGVLIAIVTRQALGAVLAWLVWLLVVVFAWVSPGNGLTAPITGFFYNAMVRIWSNYYLMVPVMAGVGTVLAVRLLTKLLRRMRGFRAQPVRVAWLAAILIVLTGLLYGLLPGREYMRLDTRILATRYGMPDLHRITGDDQAAFNYLAGKVRPGERVMNSADDGSTYLYVEKNIPVVNDQTLGATAAPYTYQLLQYFSQYPLDRQVRQWLLHLNVRWLYVDQSAPAIGAAGSPQNWAGHGLFSFPPGFQNLDDLPGLAEVFQSGPVRVYHLDLDRIAAMS